MDLKQQIKHIADILINEASSWQHKRDSLNQLHDLFVKIGGLNAFIPDSKEDDIWLKEGCAISPKSAAMCMFELARTELFLKGLCNAINDLLLQTNERPLRIMDAGAGPYALYTILSCMYFSKKDIQYLIYDIHQENIDSVNAIFKNSGLDEYVDIIEQADLCKIHFEPAERPHIIISEVMKNALQKEPQLAVTLHLNNQLRENGIFIPENIQLNLVMVNTRLELENKNNSFHLVDNSQKRTIGTICNLHKLSTSNHFTQNPIASITIPDTDYNKIQIETIVTIYKHFSLQNRDSSITFPVVISSAPVPVIQSNQMVQFYFSLEKFPKLMFEVV